MSFSGFTASDFKVFEISGFKPRMEAIKMRIRPKLEAVGKELLPDVARIGGAPAFAHVARHARRTVNPPDDTWVAFALDPRGYKQHCHFKVAVSRIGVRFLFEAGPEHAQKKRWLGAWKRHTRQLVPVLRRAKGLGWFKDEHDEAPSAILTDPPADAAIVANKIIATLSAPIQAEGHELHTSPSIGISLFPNDGPDGDTILKNADTAMYHAKAAGRNNYQFFAAEMNRITADRLDIERKLRHAIARNELTLCFQPQFAANSSQPTGVEALIRWLHPTDGMIAPDRFIPVAEETGIIVEIGEWVLLNACREMKRWIDAGLKPLRMAVNVSARQLRRRDFCETVAGVLAESGLPPELLELEITESSVMENPQEAIVILESLGRMGVTLAIDDFGTGYSSLAYLKLFPIDHLKIDRSFVADIEHDLNDRAIAFGTIALAHSLGLRVIAEGVETDDQLELLRTNGCDEVQGYLFSKPLTGGAAFAFLHARCPAR
jgi:EAL domain-containing protein (putative c-di-GMP-specific phosphodiesterase class I)